jgi:hypothetical protein
MSQVNTSPRRRSTFVSLHFGVVGVADLVEASGPEIIRNCEGPI